MVSCFAAHIFSYLVFSRYFCLIAFILTSFYMILYFIFYTVALILTVVKIGGNSPKRTVALR